MAEKDALISVSEPSLPEMREMREFKVQVCDKIARHIGLPSKITGGVLLSVIEEVFDGENSQFSGVYSEKSIDVVSRTKKNEFYWGVICTKFLKPNSDAVSVEKTLPYDLKRFIADIIWLGTQKEDILQQIEKIEGYHLAKNHALLATIASEVTQEYAEEFFEKGRWEFIKKTLSLSEQGLDFMRKKAEKLVERAKEPLKKHLTGMPVEKQEKLFGRMIKFFSEDDIGKRLMSMADSVSGAPVGKAAVGSLKSTLSGVKEGLFSPLCACMMAVMLDGAEDKEKTLIQYVTFLVAGQIVQEGGKIPFKLIEHFAEMAPKNADVRKIRAVLLKLEKAGGKASQHIILGLSVAIVVAAFQWEPAAKFVADIANSIDENWDHGDGREMILGGVSAASYIWQFSSKRFLPVAIGVEAAKVALDEVNPFNEQDAFLFKYVIGDADNLMITYEQLFEKDPIQAWNDRVDEHKDERNITQSAIIEHFKLRDAREWALKTIVPFSQELSEFDAVNSQLYEILGELTLFPNSAEKMNLLPTGTQLRYRDYALAAEDVWFIKDNIGDPYLQANPEQDPLTKRRDDFYKKFGMERKGIRKYDLNGMGNLSMRNDKALDRLDDAAGSVEDRIDEFFENECDALIAREKAKCRKLGSGGARRGYVFDEEAYKKIEPWVEKMNAAKIQWKMMRGLADSLAKKVVIARCLGVYDEKRWTDTGREGNPLIEPIGDDKPTMAFEGMFTSVIPHRAELLDLSEPKTGQQARELIQILGYEKPHYGTGNIALPFTDEFDRQKDEYEKYNGSDYTGALDRRMTAFWHLVNLAEAAYTTNTPPEYLQKALKPISDTVKNLSSYNPEESDKKTWITPSSENNNDLLSVEKIERELVKCILDYATDEAVKSGKVLPFSHPIVEVRCGSRVFQRKFELIDAASKTPGVILHDTLIEFSNTSYFDSGVQPFLFYHKSLQGNLLQSLYQKHVEDKTSLENYTRLAVEQERERITKRQEAEKHKGDSKENFLEYYQKNSENGAKWDTISDKNPLILAYRDYNPGYSARIEQKEGWGWSTPTMSDQVKVGMYWEPGKTREISIGSISDLNNPTLDEGTKKVLREVLTSGRLALPLESLISLTSGSVYHKKVAHKDREGKKFYDVELTESYKADLREKLLPYFEKAPDKKVFLSKLLDALLKQPGISGDTFDTIVRETLQ